MSTYDPARDRAPLFTRGGIDFHAVTLLTIAHVVAMVLTTVAMASGGAGLLAALSLSGEGVFRHGLIWQPLTYAFVNGPSFMFAWSMFIFFFCGRELERYFGRRAFIGLYAGMVLVAALAVLLFSAVLPAGLAGCSLPVFAVFAAFAFVNPRLVLFWIPMIWVFAICFSLSALQSLAAHAWSELFALGVVTGAAWTWTKWQRGHFTIKLPVRAKPAKPQTLPSDMDALLDKIGREGLHSLTAKERAQLEKARQDLLRK